MQQKVIDVSEWQKAIDWQQVKAQGYHAIIRLGYGSDIASQDDKYYKQNISECERLNIPHGVYLYSYAKNDKQILSEIEHAKRLLNNGAKVLQYPVYFDSEEAATASYAKIGAAKFCEAMEKLGYFVGVYASRSWWQYHLKGLEQYTKWVAEWGVKKPSISCDMWQTSESAKVYGILGKVDSNICYVDFPALISGANKTNSNTNKTNSNTSTNIRELAFDTLKGRYGDGQTRKNKLGANYDDVQKKINDWYTKADYVLNGKYGNGETRKLLLGSDYESVQYIVNKRLKND